MDIAVSNTDNLVHDCSNSSVLAMELLQSGTKPSMWQLKNRTVGFCSKLLSALL